MGAKDKIDKNKNFTLSALNVFRSGDVLKTLKNSESCMKSMERKMNNVFNPVYWNPDCF